MAVDRTVKVLLLDDFLVPKEGTKENVTLKAGTTVELDEKRADRALRIGVAEKA